MALTKEQVKQIQSQPGAIDWFGQPLKVDGDYGPKTRWWHYLTTIAPQRQAVVKLALGYHAMNVAEVPLGSNRGQMVDMFMAPTGLKPGKPWCAGFVSHCLRKCNVTWPVYHASAWSVIDWAKKNGKLVEEPWIGDVEAFLYPQKPGEDRQGHVRIVTGYNLDTQVSYGVDGNVTNCVRVGTRHQRPERYFIRPGYEEIELIVKQLPTNMMALDNLGDI